MGTVKILRPTHPRQASIGLYLIQAYPKWGESVSNLGMFGKHTTSTLAVEQTMLWISFHLMEVSLDKIFNLYLLQIYVYYVISGGLQRHKIGKEKKPTL